MGGTPVINRAKVNALLPCIVILAAALAWQAGANTAASRPPAQPTAVATIDIVEVFDKLNERSVLEQQLEKRLNDRQAQLDEVSNRLKAIRADLDPATGTLKPGTDAHKERVREMMELQAVAEARTNALRQISAIDMGALRRQLFEKITAAVAKVSERDGLDIVVLDDSAFPIPENSADNDVYRAIITKGILYRHDSVDITDRVVTLMNNEYTAP